MPAREVNRRKLTDLFVSSRKAQERPELIWYFRALGPPVQQEGMEGHLSFPRQAALAAPRRCTRDWAG
jgi:hypothetical protein